MRPHCLGEYLIVAWTSSPIAVPSATWARFCSVRWHGPSTQPTAAPLFVTVGYDTGLSATTVLAAEMTIAIYRLVAP